MLGLRASLSAWPSPAALPGGAPLSFWMGCILERTARSWRCRCLMGQFHAGCTMHLIQLRAPPEPLLSSHARPTSRLTISQAP